MQQHHPGALYMYLEPMTIEQLTQNVLNAEKCRKCKLTGGNGRNEIRNKN